ncbi:biotin-dependent carboxyltransferase family protein [Priestia taiwanensis]|uniref:Urea carboxylase n=1 Tax=Priestia taiwanensis TaxID=1347902 RepID=A0A917AWR8_9BACI|nr:biotin-dependent carboxyltransferase family protein [Priestia taiwanensis]MBM7364782.1 antagonist of KipI [Priestia taiwanensis]GGE79560.1 urea carboxylase [Priestia taiwanensis]
MTKRVFRVIKPGLFTTFQDLGRTGYQQYGMVVAGAMDEYALQLANLLVGNRRDEAALEITMMGPTLQVLEDVVIAICGGNLSPTVNGEPAPMWKSFRLNKGDVLAFGRPIEGARTYVSVAGGFDIPLVMGSKSTYVKANIGGLEGRVLQTGDVLHGIETTCVVAGRALHIKEIPRYEKEITVRVCIGPHHHAFLESSIETFFSSVYEVTPQSDRMGYRLKGPALQHAETADIISEAIPLGGIQVPANGEPIILMADRQTTGGYTRIATVISVDIPLLAQALPGCSVRFTAVSVEEAQRLYRERARFLRVLEKVTIGVNT